MPVLVDPGVVAPPAPPPPGPVDSVGTRTGFRQFWTGWDGSEWELSDYRSGAFLTPGVRGWSMPPVEHYRSESPAVAGSTHRGNRVQDRDVFWPLFLYSGGSNQDWIEFDRAFWATMDPNFTGTWTVAQPNGVRRSVDLRYASDDGTYDRDPATVGWAPYGINLVAEQPFWRSDPIVRTFRASVPAPFFSGPGIVQINSGQQLATASIDNPGQVPGWIVWTLAGPSESYVVGVGGKTIEVPFPLAVGEFLSIYTQPDQMVAIDGLQRDRTDELGAAAFTPVQPGASLPLSLSMTSPGVGAFIEASLTPYHYRAW